MAINEISKGLIEKLFSFHYSISIIKICYGFKISIVIPFIATTCKIHLYIYYFSDFPCNFRIDLIIYKFKLFVTILRNRISS